MSLQLQDCQRCVRLPESKKWEHRLTTPAPKGGGGHTPVRQTLGESVGYDWDSGWGAGGRDYKTVAAAVGGIRGG